MSASEASALSARDALEPDGERRLEKQTVEGHADLRGGLCGGGALAPGREGGVEHDR